MPQVITTAIRGSVPYSGTNKRDDPYTNLAVMVIKTAVDDYIKVLRDLMKPDLKEQTAMRLNSEKESLERFFYSQDYEFYSGFMETEVAPDVIIRQCALRAKEAKKKKPVTGRKKGVTK